MHWLYPLAGTFPPWKSTWLVPPHPPDVIQISPYQWSSLAILYRAAFPLSFSFSLLCFIFIFTLTTKHSIFHSFVLCMSLSPTPEMEAPWYKQHSLPSFLIYSWYLGKHQVRGWYLYNLINHWIITRQHASKLGLKIMKIKHTMSATCMTYCQTLTLLLIHNYPVNYFSQFCGWDICQSPNSEISTYHTDRHNVCYGSNMFRRHWILGLEGGGQTKKELYNERSWNNCSV